MQRRIIFILLGWLAVSGVVTGELLDRNEKTLDMERPKQTISDVPNGNLLEDIPQSADLDENLAYNSSSKNMGDAGRTLLELVARTDVECSNELLSSLLVLEEMSLNRKIEERAERLLRDGWERANKICTRYIEETYERSPLKKTSFFAVFNTWYDQDTNERLYRRFEDFDLYYKLRELSGDVKNGPEPEIDIYDDETHRRIVRKNRKMFDRAFDKLYVDRCEEINSDDNLLEEISTLARVEEFKHRYRSNRGNQFMVDIHSLMKIMNWTRRICTQMINLQESERTRIYEDAQL